MTLQRDWKQNQDDIYRILDCKANAMDVQEQLDQKSNDKESRQIFADKQRFEQCL